MGASAQDSVSTIDSFLKSVGAQATKTASAPLSEAGSIGGETSHPVKSVDDRLTKAKEGERSAENAKDLKEDQGPPSVDAGGSAKSAGAKPWNLLQTLAKRAESSLNPPGTADEDQLQIGTNKQPTGEDPANETNKAKAGKEDPGSSHPARTDNDSLDGHKYAYDANTPLEKMAADLRELGEDLCAHIEVASRETVKTAGAAPRQPARQPQQVKTAAATLAPEIAQQAGWEVAGILTGSMDKNACDQMVHAELTGIVKEGMDDAYAVHEFLSAREATLRKQAEEEAADPMGGDMGGGASGAGPGPGADSGGAGPVPGPESAGGGEGMDGGGGMGGGGSQGITPEMIDALCQEFGTTPEELGQMCMSMGGGDGGGGMGAMGDPSGGGAMPPPPPGGAGGAMPPPAPGGGGAMPPPPGGMEVAASDKRGANRNTKYAEVRNAIAEVVQRSRQSKK